MQKIAQSVEVMNIKNLGRTLIGTKERKWRHKKLEMKIHWSLVSIECERLTRCFITRKLITSQVAASEDFSLMSFNHLLGVYLPLYPPLC